MTDQQSVIKANKILLIEDDLQLANLIATYIKSIDYEVDILFGGDQAYEKVKNGDYDMIFLDIMMPGKDGFTVLKELKQDPKTKNVPVIMLTNLEDMASIQKGLDLGATDYALKLNLNIEKMKTLIHKHLISHSARYHN